MLVVGKACKGCEVQLAVASSPDGRVISLALFPSHPAAFPFSPCPFPALSYSFPLILFLPCCPPTFPFLLYHFPVHTLALFPRPLSPVCECLSTFVTLTPFPFQNPLPSPPFPLRTCQPPLAPELCWYTAFVLDALPPMCVPHCQPHIHSSV